jgi:hypothetical protein
MLRGGGAAEAPVERAGPRADQRDEDMRAFIGPSWRSYRALWARMKDAPRLTSRRSFAAGSLSSLWLLYRKQYRIGAAVLLAQAVMLHTEVVWSSLFDIAVAVFFGRYGMSMVLASGAKKIALARAGATSGELVSIRVGAAGGVNWVAALCGLALLMGLVAANLSSEFDSDDGIQSLIRLLD